MLIKGILGSWAKWINRAHTIYAITIVHLKSKVIVFFVLVHLFLTIHKYFDKLPIVLAFI